LFVFKRSFGVLSLLLLVQYKVIFKVLAALSFLTLVERSSCLLELCHGLPFLVFRTTRLFIQFYGVFLLQEF
jgi:hypothetical protein